MPRVLAAFPPQRRYLIGVSGGRDSVALLHWLQALGYRKLIVCHLDHGLRGRAGKADARFVEKSGGAAEIAFGSEKRGRESARARSDKCSIETAARAARLRIFRGGRAAHGVAPTIFLGHHADDLAETFLFNLLARQRKRRAAIDPAGHDAARGPGRS